MQTYHEYKMVGESFTRTIPTDETKTVMMSIAAVHGKRRVAWVSRLMEGPIPENPEPNSKDSPKAEFQANICGNL